MFLNVLLMAAEATVMTITNVIPSVSQRVMTRDMQ
jgi:hypothetical protein